LAEEEGVVGSNRACHHECDEYQEGCDSSHRDLFPESFCGKEASIGEPESSGRLEPAPFRENQGQGSWRMVNAYLKHLA
jgi:hypothetical protein